MYPIYSILFWGLLGGICAYVAKQRNRNPIGWFFLGALLGVIGLIILYILPSKAKAIETPSTAPQAAVPTPEITADIPPSPPETSSAPSGTRKLWYYLDEDNNQYGPMSFPALREAWLDDKIANSTYLWNEDMEEWKSLEDLPEIHAQIRGISS